MPDRENVIVELTAGIEDAYHRCHCKGALGLAVAMENALSLLKAQKPVKPIMRHEMDDICSCIDNVAYCGKCGAPIGRLRQKYCSSCGQAVKWE